MQFQSISCAEIRAWFHWNFVTLYFQRMCPIFVDSMRAQSKKFGKKIYILLTVLDLSYASVFILIDIVNDGELAREAYFLHFVRKIKGMNADNLVDKTIRNGRCKHMCFYRKKVELFIYRLPGQKGEIFWQKHNLLHAWRNFKIKIYKLLFTIIFRPKSCDE